MGVALIAGGLATIVVAGMGCQPPYDQKELKQIVPTLAADCDPDTVTLDYVIEYLTTDYELLAVRVNDVDEACVGSTVRVEIDDEQGLLAHGTEPVDAAGTVEVGWDEIRPQQVGSLETYSYDVYPGDVTAVRITILDEG
jgi:hypothetical protein